MGGSLRVASSLIAGVFLLAIPAAAQLKYGDFTAHMSGNVQVGYTADWGNQTSSDHGWTVGGEVDLNGYYHSPNFLSFNVTGYLNQSRANSDYQSISNSSGVNVGVTSFGGTHFPLAANYSLTYNSDGNYDVPGVANYVTHGNSSTVGVNWSESLPDAPSFSIGYQRGNSQYEVYGTNDNGSNFFQSLNLHSGYRWQGFGMSAFYSVGDSNSLIPGVITGQASTATQSSNSALGFNLSHALPFHGNVAASFDRSSWNTNYQGSTSTGSIDIVNGTASFHPINKLSISTSIGYTDNLSGQLYESIVGAGGVIPGPDSSVSSNSLDILGVVSYSAAQDLIVQGNVERRSQSYLGTDYGVTSYGAGANYSHKVFKGNFNAALSAALNTSDQSGDTTLSINTSENYSTTIHGWNVNGSFNYSQNVETLLVTYMNSSFSYSGSARKRWKQVNFSASASASRTGLTEDPGSVSSSQSYNTSIGFGSLLSATAGYSKSSGQAIATGSGLVPIPIPPVVPNSDISLYGGDSYSISLSSTPLKNLGLSASYSNSNSNSSTNSVNSQNTSNQFNALAQYHVRKIFLLSGYSRLQQGFSATGTAPQVISSFYVGVSRWFNFF